MSHRRNGRRTYEVDGDKVRVTANGQTNELTIGSDDCLPGPIMMGTLCKGEKKPSAAGASSEPTFTDGQTVKVSALAPGQPEGTGAAVGTYSTSGDQQSSVDVGTGVTITVDGSPERFTLNGNTLVGHFAGEQVTFTRK